MKLKFDSKQFGTTLLFVYLLLIIPLIYLLNKTGNDLNDLAMNPGFTSADQIREDYPKLFFVICFSFVLGVMAITSFLFYIKRNKSSIEFDETIDFEYWKETEIDKANVKETIDNKNKKENFKKENINLLRNQFSKFKSEKNKQVKTEFAIQFLCNTIEAGMGAIYLTNNIQEADFLDFSSGYAFFKPKDQTSKILFGEGLTGQVAKSQKNIIIDNLNDDQVLIFSGLGKSSPKSILITPILLEGKTVGIIEIASFKKINSTDKQFISEAADFLASEL